MKTFLLTLSLLLLLTGCRAKGSPLPNEVPRELNQAKEVTGGDFFHIGALLEGFLTFSSEGDSLLSVTLQGEALAQFAQAVNLVTEAESAPDREPDATLTLAGEGADVTFSCYLSEGVGVLQTYTDDNPVYHMQEACLLLEEAACAATGYVPETEGKEAFLSSSPSEEGAQDVAFVPSVFFSLDAEFGALPSSLTFWPQEGEAVLFAKGREIVSVTQNAACMFVHVKEGHTEQEGKLHTLYPTSSVFVRAAGSTWVVFVNEQGRMLDAAYLSL